MFHCKIYQTKSQLFALKLHVPVRNCARNSRHFRYVRKFRIGRNCLKYAWVLPIIYSFPFYSMCTVHLHMWAFPIIL